MSTEHFDVLIIGAGLSGIGAAHHLQQRCPDKRYAILEARAQIGGTWDLFRYPGIRSDSDMYTLGYAFRPWRQAKAIADGPSILDYVKRTARDGGIDRHIRFRQRVRRAQWSSTAARWSVEVEDPSTQKITHYSCSFLHMCSGYYDYAQGYMPEFPGVDRFGGRLVHPQQWPQDLDYAGKRVVVIGSGATAVTLVPALAASAAHVTMLQRSPTYIMSLPAEDVIANALRKVLPARAAYGLTRWKNVLIGMAFYALCRKAPERARKMIRRQLRVELGPDYDIDRHFSPSYKPWDQRVCLVPDGDLFRAIRSGRATVVTDHIETFTETGLKLKSGEQIDADIIVSATGLNLMALGGAKLMVDGRAVELSKTMSYKGMMLSGVPNFAFTVGYTNASWTLKADLTSDYLCRLLNHMDRHGYRQCMPLNDDPSIEALPFIDFSSSYVQRAIDGFPRQGNKRPWRLYQNYALDILTLRHGAVDDAMVFSSPEPPVAATA
jgi:monooxygenase